MLGKLQRPAMGMTRLFSTLVKKPKLELTMRTPYRTIFNNFTEFTRVYVNSLEGQIAIGTRSTSRVYLLPPGGVTVKNMQPGDGNLSESQSGEFVHGGTVPRIASLDDIPSPYLEGWMDPFFETGYFPLMQIARGCPFTCAFCNSGVTQNSKINAHSVENVKAVPAKPERPVRPTRCV